MAGMILSREVRVWDMERCMVGVEKKAQRSTVCWPWGFEIFSFWEVRRGVWAPKRAGIGMGDIGVGWRLGWGRGFGEVDGCGFGVVKGVRCVGMVLNALCGKLYIELADETVRRVLPRSADVQRTFASAHLLRDTLFVERAPSKSRYIITESRCHHLRWF